MLLEFKTPKYAKNIVNNGSDLTLEKAQEIERLQEMSTTQTNKMSHTSREVSKVNVIKKAQKLYNEKQTKRNHILVKNPAKPGDYHKPYTCTRCGYKHGVNHFKKVCSKTKTNHCVCCQMELHVNFPDHEQWNGQKLIFVNDKPFSANLIRLQRAISRP